MSYYEEEYGYKVDLEAFSGPLDLLLYLIRQDEVEITDIPIARITDQYLQHIEALQAINVNLAGEFLVMAATLMEIKSRLLLPRPEREEEEPEDPRADLIRQLIEYKKYKDAARRLAGRADEQALKFPRGLAAALGLPEREPEEDLPVLLGEVSVWDLLTAFKAILRQTTLEATHRIVMDERPASAYCNELLERLRSRPNVTFRELFDLRAGRAAIITAFLALLELIRRRRVRAEQAGPDGEIRILLLDATPLSEIELAEPQRPAEPAPEPAEPRAEAATAEEELPIRDAEVEAIAVPEIQAQTEAAGAPEGPLALEGEAAEAAGQRPVEPAPAPKPASPPRRRRHASLLPRLLRRPRARRRRAVGIIARVPARG